MEQNQPTPQCIRTVSGRYVNVFKPTPEMFCIEDIAHALANEPRFGGHLRHAYTVGQHCIAMCKDVSLMTDMERFTALMHDCTEAYLKDMPKPIKQMLPDYLELENNLANFLADLFEFQNPLPVNVKHLDQRILEAEWSEVMIHERDIKADPKETAAVFLSLFDWYKPSARHTVNDVLSLKGFLPVVKSNGQELILIS